MPRTLSLKRSQQTNTSKNQKSITDFLKNGMYNTSQKPQVTAETQTRTTYTGNKSNKRKASSPIIVDIIDLDKSVTERNFQICTNLPKKSKISSSRIHASPVKDSINCHKQRSPKKENIFNISHSPIKNHVVELKESHYNESKVYNHLTVKQAENLTLTDIQNKVKNHETLNKNDYFKKESCIYENGSKLEGGRAKVITLTKHCPLKNDVNFQNPSGKSSTTKSPIQGFHCSPINMLTTPEKILKDVLSPSKCGSTVKVLDFDSEDMCNDFADDWEVDDIEEDGTEDMDLSKIQRCEILSVKNHTTRVELRLKNCDNQKATCFLEGIWVETPLTPGDIVSLLAVRDSAGQYCVSNTSGLLVLQPDHLVSSTSVVAGVFCKRKAVLQERWRGIDSANMAMTTGILIHELVQKALTEKIMSIEQLRSVTNIIIKESVERLYDAGLSEEEARCNIYKYIPPLADFMNTYIAEKPHAVTYVQKDKNNWSGHIDKVLDIEENLCCPKLGLKGKIDATLQVTIHERKGRQRSIVPLELKSGKASMSAEHRGQLVLYGMMLNLNNGEDPTRAAQRGLLLYLKDRVELREVSCGYPERRDLVMLRNQLVQYLATSPQDIDPENLTDIEDASVLLQQKLPEPVDHHNACAKCPYLTLCSLHLWHTDGPSVSESHPLSQLRTEALGHLSPQHVKYFLHWAALLKMEERGQMIKSPLHALWTDSVQNREKRGTCAANLKLITVVLLEDRYLHIFQRNLDDKGIKSDFKVNKGPQEGEFSIVSIENRPWIAAGVVTVTNSKEIHILLERDVSSRFKEDTLFHIDTYESYASTVQNLTNLGVLMEDSERAERLRKLIIDKETPQFEAKLPRDVGRLGTRLMKSLNIQQQRAVLKSLAARDYALMRGLPGTGKTQTISVLIQMLVGLKQRVLVTAHTHSAVDTVLSRLPESLKVMRLGSSTRVAPALHKKTEKTLTADCDTPEKLTQLYDSMEVVGVTCLGATHAMLARTTFDLCIVDEATQVLQCTVLRPLFAAKRFVLVGDPEQLPPVVRSRAARRLGMEESLFHRLMCDDATSTLQLQYRMNQALTDIANQVAYNDRLKCANQNIAQAKLEIDVKKIPYLSGSPWLAWACSPEPQYAAMFLDVEFAENIVDPTSNKNSCTNGTEACIVMALVDALKQGNVKMSDIGVIAPYRDQVALLRRCLLQHAVEVSTVDQFQGKDKPVIIYSCTRHPDKQNDKKVKEGEVLNDQRRLAVSVTRAKHKFLIIGNSAAMRPYVPLHKLIQTCNSVQLDKQVVNNLHDRYRMYFS